MNFLENNREAFLARYPESRPFLFLEKGSRNAPEKRRVSSDSIHSSARLRLFLGAGPHLIEGIQRIQGLPGLPVFFLIVEKSWENLLPLFENYDLRSLIQNPAVEWFVGAEPRVFQQRLWRFFDSEARMMAAASMASVEAFSEEEEESAYYRKIKETLPLVAADRLKAVAGDPEDNYRGLANILRNRNEIPGTPLFDSLEGLFPGKPGVVVSSGPSLTKSLPFLKKYQDRLIVFCVDSALTLLLREGITPHFVACLERVPETSKLFEKMPALENTWLVANPLVVPETLEAYLGPKVFFLRDSSHLSWFFPDKTVHDMGSSSAHMAYWGLHLLGCDPILLAGQDLAFDRYSDRSHAAGIPGITASSAEKAYAELRSASADHVGEGESWVEGNDGKPILSWKYYIEFISIFERLIGRSGKKCINAIPEDYGARIPGALRLEPESAFEKFCGTPFDPRPLIRRSLGGQGLQDSPEDSLFIKKREQRHQELKQRISKAVLYLEKELRPKVLDLLHEISLFYQYHLPSAFQASYEREYFDFFAHIEKQDAALTGVQGAPYQGLIAPFTWFSKMDTVHEVSRIMNGGGAFEKKISPVVAKLRSYYRDILFWSDRSLHLFEKFMSL